MLIKSICLGLDRQICLFFLDPVLATAPEGSPARRHGKDLISPYLKALTLSRSFPTFVFFVRFVVTPIPSL